ncbi:MAG: hypothetical protein MJE77_16095 [Proteobacteria bacterium]|nr:hypothetical protein [Pseudomonadota bacterium]
MSAQTKQSNCPGQDNPAREDTTDDGFASTREPPASPHEWQRAAANDPLIAMLTALLNDYAASHKAREQQSKQPEIPADVPRFVTEYPWAN